MRYTSPILITGIPGTVFPLVDLLVGANFVRIVLSLSNQLRRRSSAFTAQVVCVELRREGHALSWRVEQLFRQGAETLVRRGQ